MNFLKLKNIKLPEFKFLAVFTVAIVSVWVLIGTFYYLASSPASEKPRSVIIKIEPGMTLSQVAALLENRDLIRNSLAFRILAYIQKKQNQILAGEYEISPSMIPVDILKQVTSGKTVLHPITIPEGYRITEITDLLAKNGLVDREEFIRLTQDPELIRTLDLPGDSLEGYLFPETYHFNKFTDALKIVRIMVKTFKEQALLPEYLERAKTLNYSFHEIVTLSSLIEKETGKDEERKIISSVFHNRLKKRMRLQTDPSVIYAIKNFDGNLRKKDLSIDSPYNTYKNFGLPPGPIANPGLQSILAALYPDDTNYLYFVSKQNGSHQFSSNLIDHNQAVKKYQLKKVRRSR